MYLLLEVGELRKPGAHDSGRGDEKEFTCRVPSLDVELRGDLFVFSDLLVNGWAKKVGGKIYVKGKVEAKAGLACSRCLTSFAIPVETSFEETYYAQGSDDSDLDDAGQIYSGGKIDLRDAIIASLILALPMKPVCFPDCKGLCPVCGCNLNVAHCDCSQQSPDPRLIGLSEFLKHMKD